MEVLVNGMRFSAVPDQLAPLLLAYAERQGRTAVLGQDGVLRVEGPDPLIATGDGQWISPRAHFLQEGEVVTPPHEQT